MISDIIGEWDVSILEKAGESFVGRVVFLPHDDKVVVKDADPEVTSRPARVEFDGEAIRFEFLSAGSSRGSTHHTYEIRLQGADVFSGTRRRGMLARVPVSGRRVELPTAAQVDPAALLAEAEAEVAVALEAARRAAERAAAARAAVPSAERSVQPVVAPAVLAALPAPSAPPAFVPVTPVSAPAPGDQMQAQVQVQVQADEQGDVPGRQLLPVSHRLSRGQIAVLAAEVFPQVYVWGGSFAAADARLREAGWQIVEIDTGETTEVDETLMRHATTVRESVAG